MERREIRKPEYGGKKKIRTNGHRVKRERKMDKGRGERNGKHIDIITVGVGKLEKGEEEKQRQRERKHERERIHGKYILTVPETSAADSVENRRQQGERLFMQLIS